MLLIKSQKLEKIREIVKKKRKYKAVLIGRIIILISLPEPHCPSVQLGEM